MHYSIEDTLGRAEQCIEGFRQRIGHIEPHPRGVQVSEIFFLYATIADYRPPQIVESGRAQGQSTYLLARCFPQTAIVSVEYDQHHPDATIAVDRLRAFANVNCLFGNARVLLPRLTAPGDVAVIDGPKGFRGLLLAAHLLRHNRPELVFLHDCQRGTRVRGAIERYFPSAFFSDDPRFVQRYCRLDTYRSPQVLDRWSNGTQPPMAHYGGTFACVPCHPGSPTAGDMLRLRAARWFTRLRRSIRKRL
jgi:hypothetical protein